MLPTTGGLKPSQFSIPIWTSKYQTPKELIRLTWDEIIEDEPLWDDEYEHEPSTFDTLMGNYLDETDPRKKTRIFNQFMQYQDQMFQRIREGITTE